jgi:serine/threonine protein kinase
MTNGETQQGPGGIDRNLILGALDQADRMASSALSSSANAGTVVGSLAAGVRSRAVDLPPGFFPGYDVVREVHRGGQGVVFEAEDRSTGDRVAIKLLHGGATTSQSALLRFQREVSVLEQLDHPRIVRVHGSGTTTDGSFYYIMDYIAGDPLDVVVRRLRLERPEADPWDETRTSIGLEIKSSTRSRSRTRARTAADPELRRLLELFAKVCDAVSAAHLQGVIHRDLKPANIRLNRQGDPVVVDFGLAKTLDADAAREHAMTATGQFVGSMPWSSPEQAEGANRVVDTRSDVYSLGVILYQMVTGGKFPYTVIGTARQVMNTIVTAEPRRPSLYDRGVNDEVETIVLKALSKEPERRYQSASELARDIRRYLDGEAIEAKRDSGWYVLSKTVSRHKAPASAAAVLLIGGLVFSVVVGSMNANLQAANRQVNTSLDREQASFDDVRQLARTFMFDFHDEIEHLRGASRARELVLSNAVAYLDVLRDRLVAAPAVERDWELLAEAADAHDRIGDLYGKTYAASVGRTDDAGEHYAEAHRLREVLLAVRPKDASLRVKLAKNREKTARYFQRLGRFEDAAVMGAEARRRFEQALEMSPDSVEAVAGVARSIGVIGDQDRRLVSGVESLDDARRQAGLAMARYTESAQRWDELAAVGIGVGLSDPELDPTRMAAIARVDAGFARLQLARRLDSAARRTDDLDMRAALSAEAESERGLAFPMVNDGLTEVRRLGQEHPGILAYKRDLYGALYALGLAHEQTAARAESALERDAEAAVATALYTEALGVTRELAMDKANLEAQRDLGLVLSRLTTHMTNMQRFDDALEFGETSLELRREIYAADPIARHDRDVAVALYKLGDLAKARAEALESDATPEDWADALDWLSQAEARFIGLEARGMRVDRELADLAEILAEVAGRLD